MAAVTSRPRQEEPVSPACREVKVDWQERERQFQERIQGLQQVTMARVGDLVPFINLELESLAGEQAKKDVTMIVEVLMELVEESMGLSKEDNDQGMEDNKMPLNTVVAENVDDYFKENHSNTFPDEKVNEKLDIKPEEIVLPDRLNENKEKELESDIPVEIIHDMSSEMMDEDLKIKDTEKIEEVENKQKKSVPVKKVEQHIVKELDIIVLCEKGERDMENELEKMCKYPVNTDIMEKVKDTKDLPLNTDSVKKVEEGIERTAIEEKVVMEEKIEEKMYKDHVITESIEKVKDMEDLRSNTISVEKVEEGIKRTTSEEKVVMDTSFNDVSVQMDKQEDTTNPEIDTGNLDSITGSEQVMVKLSIAPNDLERINKVTDMVSKVVLDIVKQVLESCETIDTEINGEAEEEYTASCQSNTLVQLHKAEKKIVMRSISIKSTRIVIDSGHLREQQKTEVSKGSIYSEVQPQECGKVLLEKKIEADQDTRGVYFSFETHFFRGA